MKPTKRKPRRWKAWCVVTAHCKELRVKIDGACAYDLQKDAEAKAGLGDLVIPVTIIEDIGGKQK